MASAATDAPPTTNGHGRRPNALTASGRKLKLDDKREVERFLKQHEQWQDEAILYAEAVPEIGYAFWFFANLLSRIRLFCATQPDKGAPPIPVDDEESLLDESVATAAIDALDRLEENSDSGISGLLYELGWNVGVTGEGYLVGFMANDAETDVMGNETKPGRMESWDIKSIQEIKAESRRFFALDDDGEKVPIDLNVDFVARIWQRSPFRSHLAWSLMKTLLEPCDELMILSRQIRATATSRIAFAGIVKIARELSFGGVNPTADNNDGADAGDPFTEAFYDAGTAAITNEGSASAAFPIIVRGKHEFIKDGIGFESMDRPADAVAAAQRAEVLERIARGLPLPVEVIFGHRDTTFANAFQVDADIFTKHVEPVVIAICQSLTKGYLHPSLTAESGAGVAEAVAKQVMIWYDPTDVVTKPDQSGDADACMTAGTISEATHRRAHGFGDADAPTEEERLFRIGADRGMIGESLAVALLRLLAAQAGIELPDPPAPTGVFGSAGALTAAGPRRLTGRELGRRLVAIDQALRVRLTTAADVALARSLDRAGKRLANKARGDATSRQIASGVPADRFAATIGRDATQSLIAAMNLADDELLAEAIDALEGDFGTWTAAAQRDALALLGRAMGLSDEVLGSYRARLEAARGQAWVQLRGDLLDLAHSLLFDPAPAAAIAGEVAEGTTVGAGLVRRAIAIAGGADGAEPGPNGAVLLDGGTRPAGGIGTGQVALAVVADNGGGVEGYEWDYGVAPRARPFEPHERLDGTQFSNFDDPVLAIDWPGPFALPGDHDGCLCDIVPVIILPGESRTEEV